MTAGVRTVVQDRVVYVLGGPLQPDVEERKCRGTQPKAEFNVFGERNRIELMSTADARGGHPTSLRRRLGIAWKVAGRRGNEPVLASGEDVGFPVALASLLRRSRRPVWIILHGSLLEGRKFALAAPLLRRARNVHLLCLSGSLRARLVAEHGFDPERCHNAGYGVDTAFFAPALPPDTPLIVSAGAANRDFATLVSAASGLGVPVRIAADSLWRPGDVETMDLRSADAEPAAGPAPVEFGSAGDYVALRELYARATVVVVPLHPARHACGYAVIAEAMAMGRPVIATRTEAPSDLIVEGETGFTVEPGDVADLRNRIAMLLAQPGLAQAMGAAGAARMREQFTLDAYCHRIETLIGGVAA